MEEEFKPRPVDELSNEEVDKIFFKKKGEGFSKEAMACIELSNQKIAEQFQGRKKTNTGCYHPLSKVN